MSKQTGVPDECECGSRLYRSVWGVERQETDKPLSEGNKSMQRVGFECVECGSLHLTRPIPMEHADNGTLKLPDGADHDYIRGGGAGGT